MVTIGLFDDDDVELPKSGWIELDGVIHVIGGSCCLRQPIIATCRDCHAAVHTQITHNGTLLACENCDPWNEEPPPAEFAE